MRKIREELGPVFFILVPFTYLFIYPKGEIKDKELTNISIILMLFEVIINIVFMIYSYIPFIGSSLLFIILCIVLAIDYDNLDDEEKDALRKSLILLFLYFSIILTVNFPSFLLFLALISGFSMSLYVIKNHIPILKDYCHYKEYCYENNDIPTFKNFLKYLIYDTNYSSIWNFTSRLWKQQIVTRMQTLRNR